MPPSHAPRRPAGRDLEALRLGTTSRMPHPTWRSGPCRDPRPHHRRPDRQVEALTGLATAIAEAGDRDRAYPLAEKLHRDWRHISFARLLRTQALRTSGLLPRAAPSPPAAAGSAELALRHYRTARPPTRAWSAGNGPAASGPRGGSRACRRLRAQHGGWAKGWVAGA